jgi:nucleoside-diphosphate-sugar epimerase
MKILVTGATGFTGSCVVPRLLARGADVRCLVRSTSDTSGLPQAGIRLIRGNLDDRDSLALAMQGADLLVNLASLGFGHAGNVVKAAMDTGIRRALFISTTAIFTGLNARSKAVRLAAEETITRSGLAYTILRPTMIYGSPRDRNMSRLIRYLQRWPLVFVAGGGQALQQPVYVEDVAEAVVRAIESADTLNKAYNVAGATVLSFDQVVDTICGLLRRSVRKVHVPWVPLVSFLSILERLSIRLPIKAEQILRLNEDKAFDYSAAGRDFGYQPRSFAEGIRLELAAMGLGEYAST